MKDVTRIFAIAAAAIALLTTGWGSPAEARRIHHTAPLHAATHDVNHLKVERARFVIVRSERETFRMLRFALNDGSAWLSPNPDCLGPRRGACKSAWRIVGGPHYTFGMTPTNLLDLGAQTAAHPVR
jgi:hypothetical protein